MKQQLIECNVIECNANKLGYIKQRIIHTTFLMIWFILKFWFKLTKNRQKNSYKSIGIYKIRYITTIKIDDYENNNNLNPLCLVIGKADGHIEERNWNKYLVCTSADVNKKVLGKVTKFCDEIKHLIETINEGKKGEYEKYFMKIKFNSADDLPLNKMLKLHKLTVILRSVF